MYDELRCRGNPDSDPDPNPNPYQVTQREITNGVHRGTLQLKRGMTTVRPPPHTPLPPLLDRRRPPQPTAAARRRLSRLPPLQPVGSLSLSLSRTRPHRRT